MLISQIPDWLPGCVTQPYSYGRSLLHRAHTGVHPLLPTKLALKERVICAAKGILYVIPVIASIIWIAHQVFGPSQTRFTSKLITTGRPAGGPAPEPAAVGMLGTVASYAVAPFSRRKSGDAPEAKSDKLNILDTRVISWHTIPRFNEVTIDRRCSSEESLDVNQKMGDLRERYIYNRDGVLQSFRREEREGVSVRSIEMTPRKPGELEVGKETHSLKKNLPWIQETTFGLSSFVLSNLKELHFYQVEIANGASFLVEKVAIRQKDEDGGKQIKVTISPADDLSQIEETLWFNAKNGQLIKSVAKEEDLVKTNEMPVLSKPI